MKRFLHILLITNVLFFFSSVLFSQEKEDIHIVFMKDMGAKDYYTLLDCKEEVLKFKLIEACIPKGLIAIEYVKGYNEVDLRNYMQSVILKLTDKLASPTSYTIEDLRQACSEYREGLNE